MDSSKSEVKTTVVSLANEMGVTESDLRGFIDCLQVWVSKGYSFEQAIAKHGAQMKRLLDNGAALPRSIVVNAFFPA